MRRDRKLLFIIKQRYVYGEKTKAYGLYNSCDFVARKLNEMGIETKVVQVKDNNDIDREVSKFKPTDCFIEALWVVPEKFNTLSKLHPSVTWHIRLHSKIPFLATEGIAFGWMNEYVQLRKHGVKILLSANNQELYDDLKELYPGCVTYTPNVYFPDEKKSEKIVYHKDEKEFNIGLFGALRPLKNHLQQAIWADKFSKVINRPVAVHINATEHEKTNSNTSSILTNIKNVFNNSSNRLVEHQWYPHSDFLQLVKQMDLGLQVSFSETFNITAADFVYMNVPLVVSNEIKFVNKLCRLKTSDTENALNVMKLAYEYGNYGLNMTNKYLLDRTNKNGLTVWKNLFGK